MTSDSFNVVKWKHIEQDGQEKPKNMKIEFLAGAYTSKVVRTGH